MCPFCKQDPYEYVNIGIGSQAVAVNCCEAGYALIVEGIPYKKIKKAILIQKRRCVILKQLANKRIKCFGIKERQKFTRLWRKCDFWDSEGNYKEGVYREYSDDEIPF